VHGEIQTRPSLLVLVLVLVLVLLVLLLVLWKLRRRDHVQRGIYFLLGFHQVRDHRSGGTPIVRIKRNGIDVVHGGTIVFVLLLLSGSLFLDTVLSRNAASLSARRRGRMRMRMRMRAAIVVVVVVVVAGAS